MALWLLNGGGIVYEEAKTRIHIVLATKNSDSDRNNGSEPVRISILDVKNCCKFMPLTFPVKASSTMRPKGRQFVRISAPNPNNDEDAADWINKVVNDPLVEIDPVTMAQHLSAANTSQRNSSTSSVLSPFTYFVSASPSPKGLGVLLALGATLVLASLATTVHLFRARKQMERSESDYYSSDEEGKLDLLSISDEDQPIVDVEDLDESAVRSHDQSQVAAAPEVICAAAVAVIAMSDEFQQAFAERRRHHRDENMSFAKLPDAIPKQQQSGHEETILAGLLKAEELIYGIEDFHEPEQAPVKLEYDQPSIKEATSDQTTVEGRTGNEQSFDDQDFKILGQEFKQRQPDFLTSDQSTVEFRQGVDLDKINIGSVSAVSEQRTMKLIQEDVNKIDPDPFKNLEQESPEDGSVLVNLPHKQQSQPDPSSDQPTTELLQGVRTGSEQNLDQDLTAPLEQEFPQDGSGDLQQDLIKQQQQQQRDLLRQLELLSLSAFVFVFLGVDDDASADPGKQDELKKIVQAAVPAVAVGAGAMSIITGVEGALEMVGFAATASFIYYDLLNAESRRNLRQEFQNIKDHRKLLEFLKSKKIVQSDEGEDSAP